MKLRAWAKRGLVLWGGFSLVLTFALIGYLAYSFGPGNVAKVDQANLTDVRFILNWCNLGEDRIERVLHSYLSPRSGPGGSDHLDAYAIKISHIDFAELTEDKGWYRGDRLPPMLNEALSFVGGWLHEVKWYPPESTLRSSDFYVYPWRVQTHGLVVSDAQVIFVRPSDKTVFYFSGST